MLNTMGVSEDKMSKEFIVNMGWKRKLRLTEHDKRKRGRKPFDGPAGVWAYQYRKPHKYSDSGFIRTVTETKPVSGTFNISVAGNSAVVSSGKEVKERIRRIRPQEAEQLDQIDQQITELRNLRAIVQKTAWNNGHKVTLKEIGEWAEEFKS